MNATPWLLDARGQRYDLTDDAPVDSETACPALSAMVHACSQIVRFTGHAKRP